MKTKRTVKTPQLSRRDRLCSDARRFAVWLLIPFALASVIATQQLAQAITINMSYFNEGDPVPHDENPTWDPAGLILKSHFQAAKAIWENLLPGSGSYDLEFEWDDDIDESGLTSPDFLNPGGWIVEMNSTKNWFADPTPGTNEEFGTTPNRSVYSTLSAADQSTFFPVASPPLALETGFILEGTVGAAGLGGYDAHDGKDLLSVILHEIGHVLALNELFPGDYPINPQHVGGLEDVWVLGTFDTRGSHLAGGANVPGFLMVPAAPSGVRILPSATDVLVIAEDQGISNVHLARVDRISNGNWNNTNAWIGADVPDATQDAYLRHAGAVTLDVNASVKSLIVDVGSNIDAASFRLAVASDIQFQGSGTISVGAGGVVSASEIRFDGGALSAGAGGTISAHAIHGDPATLTTAAGSTIEFNNFTRGASSTIAATFNGNVKTGVGLVSAIGALTFNPDTIEAWTIGQNLTIGASRAAKLVIDDGAWSVGGNLDIQGSKFVESEVVVEGGTLGVTGLVTIGGHGALTYKSQNASNTTYTISGGGTSIVTLPPPTHLENSPGGRMTFESISPAGPVGAGSAIINVGGGTGDGAPGGEVTFKGNSNAGDAEFWNKSGVGGVSLRISNPVVIAGTGGHVVFEDDSNADTAHFRNDGVNDHGPHGSGGATYFGDDSRAASAVFDNYGSTLQSYTGAVPAPGGRTEFYDDSSAWFGTFNNHPGQGMGALGAGVTIFRGNSTAEFGTFYNKGGVAGLQYGGSTEFYDNAKAGVATFHNEHNASHSQGAPFAGNVRFYGNSSADRATFHNQRGGGTVWFNDASTAGDGHFFIEDAGTGTFYGHVIFQGNSKGGTADLTIKENCFAASIEFLGASNAEQAQITLVNGAQAGVTFGNSASMGQATIDIGSANQMFVRESATAANSTIRLRPGASATFYASAGSATINVDGGTVSGGGTGGLYFGQSGSTGDASNAIININGGTAPGAIGGILEFGFNTSAGSATIVAGAGVAGAGGGRVSFSSSTNATGARFTIAAGGSFDVYGLGGTSIGSLDAAGSVFLGQAELRLGGLNTSNTISGPISGYFGVTDAKLTKVGTGTLTLSGANTYYGLTKVDGGALAINGSTPGAVEVNSGAMLKGTGSIAGAVTLNSGGTLAPGASPGKMTIGGLNLTSGSTLAMEIGGVAAGTQYDQVISTGAFSLAGALNVSLVNGFSPSAGQSFNLFDWGTASGSFSALSLPTLGGSLAWNTSQLYATGVLSVAAAALPGDFTGDGFVNAADLAAWRAGFGTGSTRAQGDSDGDADVDGADFLAWQLQFGAGAPAVSANVPTPEPASLLLCVIALAAIRQIDCRMRQQQRVRA